MRSSSRNVSHLTLIITYTAISPTELELLVTKATLSFITIIWHSAYRHGVLQIDKYNPILSLYYMKAGLLTLKPKRLY